MGRPKGAKKDEFDCLSADFKDAVYQSNTDDIRHRFAKVALLDAELREAKKNDMDLQERKDALKVATEPYSEAFKAYRLQIKFCKQVLDNKGGGNTVSSDNVNSAS